MNYKNCRMPVHDECGEIEIGWIAYDPDRHDFRYHVYAAEKRGVIGEFECGSPGNGNSGLAAAVHACQRGHAKFSD